MKTKIILIALLAIGAMASIASTQIAKKNKIENAGGNLQSTSKSGGFVSEEI
jgi:hypothetical protein